MQEYSFPIDDGLINGLTPDPLLPVGSGYASVMRNLRPEGFAGTGPEIIHNATRSSMSWPFPKIVRDERVTLLLGDTTVRTVTEADPTYTTVLQTLKSSFDRTTTVTLTAGTKWEFCAFEDGHWFATNGADTVFKLSTYSPPMIAYFDASTTKLAVKSICRHDDRLVLSGLSGGTWFTDTRWAYLFKVWRLKQRAFMHSNMTWDDKWVVWSQRRGGATDGPFFLLMCALGLFGTAMYDKFEAEIVAAVENGDIGFASAKDIGAPRTSMALDGAVRVYGASSICTLSPNEAGGYTPSYDRSSGVRGSALSGDESEHAWIDSIGELRHSKHGRLGFRWIFQSTETATNWATPIMSFDPHRREHWISNGTDTYVLTAAGKLGGPFTFTPTGLIRSGRLLVGVTQYQAGFAVEMYPYSAIPNNTTWTTEYTTHPFDMGYRGSKRIQVVEARVELVTALKSAVSAREGSASSYTSLGDVPFNSEGASYPLRSGNDFKATVKGTVNAGARYAISGVVCRYQGESRAHRRGTGAPATASTE
jgi:hypothetical protein